MKKKTEKKKNLKKLRKKKEKEKSEKKKKKTQNRKIEMKGRKKNPSVCQLVENKIKKVWKTLCCKNQCQLN